MRYQNAWRKRPDGRRSRRVSCVRPDVSFLGPFCARRNFFRGGTSERDITLFIFPSAPYAAILPPLWGVGARRPRRDGRYSRYAANAFVLCISDALRAALLPGPPSSHAASKPPLLHSSLAPLSLSLGAENCRLICYLKTFSRRLI